MESAQDRVSYSSTKSVTALAPGQSVGGGRYLLKKVLGQGGMGVVWLSHDRLLREPVALKFLPAQIGFDPAALEGLRRETLQARRLSHPNILRIHDLVDAAGEPTFISMEYVDGVDLHTLRANRPAKVLTWKFLRPLARQICEALAYAHGQRVIHRDLKPANLLLDSNGRVKLGDFGLARVITDSLSRMSTQGQTSGTLAYMSPQQADGRKPQIADDVYAFGVTLYELLTSTPPFHSGDIAYQLRHNPPDAIQTRLAELKLENSVLPSVAALIMACLAKEPEHRPQSAWAIIEWIDALEVETPAGNAKPRDSDRPETTQAKVEPGAKWPGISLSRLKVWLLIAAAACLAAALAWAATRLRSKSGSTATGQLSITQQSSGTADAFQPLFNGRDLTGWDGDPTYWSIQEGAITAFAPEEGVKRRENTCLIWHEPLADFELRLSYRQKDVITEKPANSGIMYRARRLGEWQMRGYQMDLHGPVTGTLLLLQEDLRDLRVEAGKVAVLKTAKNETAIEYSGTAATAAELRKAFKKGDWNDIVITAQGNRLRHVINGVTTADVMDERPLVRALSGLLALEMKRATVVQFRDIRLKKL
jgi:serine/threonine protein kinase